MPVELPKSQLARGRQTCPCLVLVPFPETDKRALCLSAGLHVWASAAWWLKRDGSLSCRELRRALCAQPVLAGESHLVCWWRQDFEVCLLTARHAQLISADAELVVTTEPISCPADRQQQCQGRFRGADAATGVHDRCGPSADRLLQPSVFLQCLLGMLACAHLLLQREGWQQTAELPSW